MYAVHRASGSEGIVCLANDGIIDGLIALAQSLHANSPGTPVTIIPFDTNLEQTRRIAGRLGYEIYDDPSLEEMDALGRRYWAGDSWRAHTMRKFCAFWGPYDRFMFLDADIVVLESLDRYFEALRAQQAEFMYFTSDMSKVYKGPLRDEMVAHRAAVGFNTGLFMGLRGGLTPPMLEDLLAACQAYRDGFVDLLEQTFLNYAVDVSGLSKVDAHAVVTDAIDAWAGVRLKRRNDGLVLADARTPESGRKVTLIHWAGYPIAPSMPYRSTFLTYRLADATPRERISYRIGCIAASLRHVSLNTPRWLVHHWRVRARTWLECRGFPAWRL